MINGATNISRGWPATHVLKLTSDQKVIAKSSAAIAGDDVVLSAVQHPPRIGEIRPISALLPDVLARYGFRVTEAAINKLDSSIDVSV